MIVPAVVTLAVGAGAPRHRQGLGGPGRHRHRVRAGRARARRPHAAADAARLPAHARDRRRPRRHHPDRGAVHRALRDPAAARCDRRDRRVRAAPARSGSAAGGSTCRWRSWPGRCCTRAASTRRWPASRSGWPPGSTPDPGEHEAPAERLEHVLQPISAGICVPAFAFMAAGVPLSPAALERLRDRPGRDRRRRRPRRRQDASASSAAACSPSGPGWRRCRRD